jgi:hypothetical protein
MKKFTILVMLLLVAVMAVGKTQKTRKAHKFRNRKLVVDKTDVGVPFTIGSDTFLIRDAYLAETDQRIDWVEGKQRYSFWCNGDTLQCMTNQNWIWSVGCDNSRKANKLLIITEENVKDTIVRKVYYYTRSGKKFVWNKRPPRIYKIAPKAKKLPNEKQNKRNLTLNGRI